MGLRIPYRLKHVSRFVLQPAYRRRYLALKQLKRLPRYTRSTTALLGREIQFVDAASLLFMYREIFEQQIYKFRPQGQRPLILDCGANIGLSVLYFKETYPDSRVIAFEPDPSVFEVLRCNVAQFGFCDVELSNSAVWSSNTTLTFMSEGADGGRVVQLEQGRRKYSVPALRLRDYLAQPVAFLKLDIEGAETEVLEDCQDLLQHVENVFVEYHSFADQPQTLHVIINILQRAGYRLHIHPPVISPQPFFERRVHLGMDMQLNIFAFRDAHGSS